MKIEVPDHDDLTRLAKQLLHADAVVLAASGEHLTGDVSDLELVQKVMDAKALDREATYSLQALGIAFGKVFVNQNENYDWWMVEDEYGRDPSIQYKETSIRVFPQTMISKRVEDDQTVNVREMYDGLLVQLGDIRKEISADE